MTSIPAVWEHAFADRLDFDAAFQGLSSSHSFQAALYRGRIRSIQLRVEEAWNHFDHAERIATAARESLRNLLHQFLLEVFRLDNMLVDVPIDPGTELPALQIPALRESVLEKYPEIRFALNLRRHVDAILNLHAGRTADALSMWTQLVNDNSDQSPKRRFAYYAGLAACHYNVGDQINLERHLECLELAIVASDRTLYHAHGSAITHALYTYMDRPEKAEEWKQFLLRLPCPQASKDLFLERSRRVVERCVHCQAAVIF